MNLVDLTIKEFLNEVDSSKPAPGGGSVSALVSSLGIGLSRMVAHLTINKKKYLVLDENIRKEYEDNFNNLKDTLDEMYPLIDEDTKAFNMIMSAYKLPRETEEEKQKRSEAIQVATLEAIKVPAKIADLSYSSLLIINKMIDYGNKNALTDIGVGALLLQSGLEGAIFNVRINLHSLEDKRIVEEYNEKCFNLLKEANVIKKDLINKVYAGIA